MKILVVSLAGIGDTLFATPLIRELRANFPQATIEALAMWAGSRDILANNPHLNGVHQKNLIKSGKLESFQFVRGLRGNRYDISINTYPQSRIHYRLLARLIGADVRVSHEYEGFGALDWLLVNKTLPQDYQRHAAENNLSLLPLIGAKRSIQAHETEIYLTKEGENLADEFLLKNKLAGMELIGMHVGSGGTKNLALRRWPLANYIELARRLEREKPDAAILFFGGPEEEADHRLILEAVGSKNIFFPRFKNIVHAASLVKRCQAFLSVDTALMCIAAAMKVKRQIVIETPTWNPPIYPYSNPFILVRNPVVNGRGLEYYRYDGGNIKGSRDEILDCMASVKVEAVLESLVGK